MCNKTEFERIKEIFGGYFAVETAKIKPEADILDDLALDSLDQVELIMLAEEEFDIAITDKEADELKTVQQLVDLVAKKLAEDAA